MKKCYVLLLLTIVTLGCEDVINVDLNEAEERLVIEASLFKQKGFSGNNQQIRITKTRGFFEDSLTTIEDAVVTVTKEDNGQVFEFIHDSAGFYKVSDFNAELMKKYRLKVEVDGEIYTAEETFIPVAEIDSVTQRSDAGFGGDEIELKAYYTDPAGEENFYLFSFVVNFVQFPTTEIFDDEFFDGNTIFALYQEEELEPGNEVIIQNFGMSKQFYEYMFILLSQTGDAGGPFQTQPATVRGNIINETNPDHYPFGYFSLSESDQLIYTVQ
ncbi:DUF4249 domain-containing protein [Mesohalobacter halotolerans]|uniref:DUF4249 domain-containing protein n=1 Tax=Mesohalobacter halotolerans TaxID=1883405 RepID=A0A4U5TQA6_9FLAO|nr:DUF4249 domain-containing protein [Mesohalobacter halotolerans]TKS56206.1 DUF4249 domain-containing protein [Mesohalobacter halotolerans]